jgi:hypothetical protein
MDPAAVVQGGNLRKGNELMRSGGNAQGRCDSQTKPPRDSYRYPVRGPLSLRRFRTGFDSHWQAKWTIVTSDPTFSGKSIKLDISSTELNVYSLLQNALNANLNFDQT